MKKLCLMATAVALFVSVGVNAETVTGKVVDTKGNMITVKTEDGQHATMKLTDNTTYRQKKVAKRDMKKHGKMYHKGKTYYTPLVEEDDWIELTYTPSKNALSEATVEDIIVYDD